MDGALKNRLSIFNEKCQIFVMASSCPKEPNSEARRLRFLWFRKPKKTVDKERWKSRIATEPTSLFLIVVKMLNRSSKINLADALGALAGCGGLVRTFRLRYARNR